MEYDFTSDDCDSDFWLCEVACLPSALLGPLAYTACSAVCFYAWTDCAQDAQDAYDRCIENCEDYGEIC